LKAVKETLFYKWAIFSNQLKLIQYKTPILKIALNI